MTRMYRFAVRQDISGDSNHRRLAAKSNRRNGQNHGNYNAAVKPPPMTKSHSGRTSELSSVSFPQPFFKICGISSFGIPTTVVSFTARYCFCFFSNNLKCEYPHFFLQVKRLRRRPLTAETRVRFPYGLLLL